MASRTTVPVQLPSMGESVAEGTVLEWLKQVGDEVTEGEDLLVVSTDKVDAEIPAPADGVLTAISAEEGATVTPGETVGEIDPSGEGGGSAGDDTDGEDAQASANGGGPDGEADTGGTATADDTDGDEGPSREGDADGDDAQPQASASGDGDDDGAAQASGSGDLVDVVTPSGGESVQEATLLEWLAEEGAEVVEGEDLVIVSTDKVDMELAAPASGVLEERLHEEGDTIVPEQVIGRVRTGAAASGGGSGSGGGGSSSSAGQDEAQGESDGDAGGVPAGVKASPVAARVAKVEGVDLGGVSGSGPQGRITKQDVLDAKQNGGSSNGASASKNGSSASTSPAPEGKPEPTPLRGGAATLARFMDESRKIPTATSFRTLTITTLDGRRRQLKEAGQKVSFTHLIAYAIARAATEEMPVMTRSFSEVEGKPHVLEPGACHLGIAVDVQLKRGGRTLMVPVIKDAGRKSFSEFLDAFNELIAKARDNKLQADDLQGANVQLTNPGGVGTVASVPRLMQGNGTIVATGSIAYPVGLGEVGALIGAEKVMTMTSTYDHRVIQGAESGQFLKTVEEFLQGEHEFYEQVFESLGAELGDPIAKPTPQLDVAAAGTGAAAGGAAAAPGAPDLELLQAVQAAVSLIKAYRTHGHLAAHLDPLGSEPKGDPSLDPKKLGLDDEALAKRIPAGILRVYTEGETLADVLPRMDEVYCGTIAYEIEHIGSDRQRLWLREAIESGRFDQQPSEEGRKALLRRLNEVDTFERFMRKTYLGSKTFSIEGLDATVPVLDELTELAGTEAGAEQVVIGMAHRGRLNVLAHNLGKPYDLIFTEFEGASAIAAVKTITQDLQGGTGDVKYHHGATGRYELEDGSHIGVVLESNPSHLEFVHPVVVGATRAAQSDHGGGQLKRDGNLAIPIVIHGDAAFPGQGVVAETLNMQGLEGYKVGGTVHLITNNQVGFTTEAMQSRSTRWASDMAKGFDCPIIHVNADDVEACVTAARLAFAFRQEFGHDVVIELIGYRRFGHNEADEPAYTQPTMYKAIKDHEPVSGLYAKRLVADGVLTEDEVEQQRSERWDHLAELHKDVKRKVKEWQEAGGSIDTSATGTYLMDRSRSEEPETKVDAERLKQLNADLREVPEGFNVHRKLKKFFDDRDEAMGENGGITWAHAEALAYGSLIQDGVPVRLTGQDAERGTFSQRHLVLHDSENGDRFAPIQALGSATVPFEVHNSPLSEVGCMGFEYGFSQEAPESLVLWEGQFGDFVNGAQVIVDQFIAAGLAKWGQTSRLTLLLPHGYEGQGPEHSSARLERFLQVSAEGNLRVANVTTPAQYFHLLRRQALIEKARPLIVMTPKSLLRLPQARNRLEHLSETRFFPVLGEPGVDPDKVTRLLLCSGKVFYDLRQHELREGNEEVAIGRVELLYPFPEGFIKELIGAYPNLREVVWVQEEPRNAGARAHMFPRLTQILPEGVALGYVGRQERASPSEGYPAAHTIEQNRICKTALDTSVPVSQFPKRSPGNR